MIEDAPNIEDASMKSEALKYEIHGLRSEMIMYMNQITNTENFALSAAALAFVTSLSIDKSAAAVLLSAAPVLILYLAFERIKVTRHRVTRLGMYIYLREKVSMPMEWGWEHFVYRFRAIEIDSLAKYLDPERKIDKKKAFQSKVIFSESELKDIVRQTKELGAPERARVNLLDKGFNKVRSVFRKVSKPPAEGNANKASVELLNEIIERIDGSPGAYTGALTARWSYIIDTAVVISIVNFLHQATTLKKSQEAIQECCRVIGPL